jgi:hypothetical protein
MSRFQLRLLSVPAWSFVTTLCAAALLLVMLVWGFAQELRQHQNDVVREARFDFSLSRIKVGFEAGLRLGLSAVDVPLTQQRIDQMRIEQPDILSIDIFDAQGRILFSTDQAGLGASIEGTWWQTCLRPHQERGKGRDADSQWQCRSLIDSFDQPVAAVLLRHRLDSQGSSADRWFTQIGLWAISTVGMFLLVLGGLGWYLARPLHTTLLSWYAALMPAGMDMLPSPHINSKDTTALPVVWTDGIESWEKLNTAINQAEAEADQIDQMEVM